MNRVLILGPARLLGNKIAQAFALAELVNGNTPIQDPLEEVAKQLKEAPTYFVLPKHHRINQHPNDDWRGQGNRKKRVKRNDR